MKRALAPHLLPPACHSMLVLAAVGLLATACTSEPQTQPATDGGTTPELDAEPERFNPHPCNLFDNDCIVQGAGKCGVSFESSEPGARGEPVCLALTGQAQLGEACERPDGVAGEDTCAPGLYCGHWGHPAGEPQARTCHSLCDATHPCATGEVCTQLGAGGIGTCKPTCDPFDPQACGEGTKCGAYTDLLGGTAFFCDFDGAGRAGDSCIMSMDCASQHRCLSDESGSGACAVTCDDRHLCPDERACLPVGDDEPVGACSTSRPDLSCLGQPRTPGGQTATVTVRLQPFEIDVSTGLTVHACELDDALCATPVATGVTSSAGMVDLAVPLGNDGFDGYFMAEPPPGAPLSLTFPGLPVVADQQVQISVVATSVLDIYGTTPFDDDNGLLWFDILDCSGDGVARLQVASSNAGPDSVTGYVPLAGPFFDPERTETALHGSGGITLHPPGQTTVTWTSASTGEVMRRVVDVRAGAMVYVAGALSP